MIDTQLNGKSILVFLAIALTVFPPRPLAGGNQVYIRPAGYQHQRQSGAAIQSGGQGPIK